jgi:hypothetical protein
LVGGVSGGLDDAAKAFLPLQKSFGPQAAGELDLRGDRFLFEAGFTRSFVDGRGQLSTTAAAVTWDRQWTGRLSTRAKAGLTDATGTLQKTSVLPTAAAGVAWKPPEGVRAISARLDLGATPAVDATTGGLVTRLDAQGAVALPLSSRLSLAALAGLARGITAADPHRVYWGTGASASWRFAPSLQASCGFRTLRELDTRWAVFVALSASVQQIL